MGNDIVEIVKVVGTVSRHNSTRDDEHDALVEELRHRLTEIVEEPKYREILAMVV